MNQTKRTSTRLPMALAYRRSIGNVGIFLEIRPFSKRHTALRGNPILEAISDWVRFCSLRNAMASSSRANSSAQSSYALTNSGLVCHFFNKSAWVFLESLSTALTSFSLWLVIPSGSLALISNKDPVNKVVNNHNTIRSKIMIYGVTKWH